ncbi:MAG: alpha-mannosidase [Spirochaetales bacterium]|nr:alpha-mannosidase [Spirochaetales bacterium]
MRGWFQQGRRITAVGRIGDFIQELKRTYVHDELAFTATQHTCDERLPLIDTFDLERLPIREGEKWGSAWQSSYFVLSCDLPKEYEGKELAVRLNLGGEMLVYSENGTPLYGLTSYSHYEKDYLKDVHRIGFRKGKVTLYVEVAANDLFGIERDEKKLDRSGEHPEGVWNGVFTYARIGIFDDRRWKLYLAGEFLFDLYQSIDKDSPRAIRVLGALLDAALIYPVRGTEAALSALTEVLDKPAVPSALSTTAVGHAHIDTAWLWPIAETHRKVTRTFASQLRNLERYPSYLFGASTPQHYRWVKEEHPALYSEIKSAVASGRWEPLGAMWVEPDCSLVSGESLVRQIVEGKRFFRKEFGVDVRNCWIPDVFGYPASLPQILKKADVPYFLTQKISWNAHTRFPHETFLWEGIDGSQVITHFLPERTYNSGGRADGLIRAERGYLEKDRLDEFLTAVGIGDGGGGPKDEHIERIILAENLEGVPKSSFGRVDEFFDRLQAARELLDVYRGELYLELHRGTLTTQARTKKNNRIFEEAVRVIESLFATQKHYPREAIRQVIRDGLMLQFHDILPGSSIGMVYREADALYRTMFETLGELIVEYLEDNEIAWRFISSSFFTQDRGIDRSTRLSIYRFNDSDDMRLVKLEGLETDGKSYMLDGKYPLTQFGDSHWLYLPLTRKGWNSFVLGERTPERVSKDSLILENDHITYEFDSNGRIVKAVDRMTGRDWMHGRAGNALRLYADTPQKWEAWDIDYYYRYQEIETLQAVEHRYLVDNESFAALRFVYKTECSTILQYAILPKQGREIYFKTHADWNECRKLLRVEFPVDPMVEWASCDIPYGLLKRKTHIQDEQDFARFEFAARGFVDVGDGKTGAALLSDSKYGYSCRDGALGMSLLRAPLDPDPFADLGEHSFVYAFCPYDDKPDHVRGISDALNAPDIAVFAEEPISVDSQPLALEGSGVELSVLKQAETSAALVFRAVESGGQERLVMLRCDSSLVFNEADLLEDVISDKEYRNGDLLEFRPFEIRTFVQNLR